MGAPHPDRWRQLGPVRGPIGRGQRSLRVARDTKRDSGARRASHVTRMDLFRGGSVGGCLKWGVYYRSCAGVVPLWSGPVRDSGACGVRPVISADLTAAARVLVPTPDEARPAVMRLLIAQAEAADRYRKRFGRAHPEWGNGTLMAAALAHGRSSGRSTSMPVQGVLDRSYLMCQKIVLDSLLGV